MDSETKIVRVICPHDCPDTCCMSVTVQDGKVTAVKGEEFHPFTRGFLCVKTNHYMERLYSPLRLLYPQRRIGKKGEGKFERISWDEAISEIAEKFHGIKDKYGAESILPWSYAGNMGKLAYASMDRRFFNYLGASQLDRTICATAATEGYVYTMGERLGTDPESLTESKLIIAWGANLVSSNVHLVPFLNEARKKGAVFVTIDPHKSKTAEQADIFIQPLPGTDAALALGMMHVIIGEDLYDKDFVRDHTFGFESLREHVKQYTPQVVAAITGLSIETIVDFARLYARTKPSCIRLNYGLSRHTNGGMMVRTVACLPAIVGAWGVPGGGAMLSLSGAFHINTQHLERPDFLKRHAKMPRTVNMIKLGESLTETNDPPVNGLFVYNANPAAVAPDQARVIDGLMREDLFTVVHEQVMTDTALYADILLPAPTVFEDNDIYTAYGHFYLQLNEAAVPPLGEAKANVEMFALIAKKMGFDDPSFDDDTEALIRQALDSPHPHMQGLTYEKLKAETFLRLNIPRPFIPFADGKYKTESGKIELYSERLLRAGLSPLPVHVPIAESAAGNKELFAKYPLQFVSPAAHHFLNSSFADMPTMKRREKVPTLEMHPHDAQSRGIRDGDWLRAFNDRGETFFRAKVGETVAPGVTCHVSLWWRQYSPGGFNCNVLTSAESADMGGGATFHTCLIQVARLTAAELELQDFAKV